MVFVLCEVYGVRPGLACSTIVQIGEPAIDDDHPLRFGSR
jgi:hypothetical protein